VTIVQRGQQLLARDKVNERLETNVPGIYALGDVKGGPAFTHISYDDWRIIRTNLLEGGHATTTGRLAPYTVFIDPQLGRVGLTEAEARAQGRSIRVAKLPMSDVARALEVDESRGFMKAVVGSYAGRTRAPGRHAPQRRGARGLYALGAQCAEETARGGSRYSSCQLSGNLLTD
jgi:pyruvate/2-oxoglutarate dehydrogenase complex dihydrolipoamide dehydrogenase (E3) component